MVVVVSSVKPWHDSFLALFTHFFLLFFLSPSSPSHFSWLPLSFASRPRMNNTKRREELLQPASARRSIVPYAARQTVDTKQRDTQRDTYARGSATKRRKIGEKERGRRGGRNTFKRRNESERGGRGEQALFGPRKTENALGSV